MIKLIKVQLVKDLKFTKQVFKHPIDTFYDIKQMHKGSYLSATIIYILFILVNIVSFYLTSFIFRTSSVESYSILRTVFYTFRDYLTVCLFKLFGINFRGRYWLVQRYLYRNCIRLNALCDWGNPFSVIESSVYLK